MDKIILKNIHLSCNIGVTAEEREVEQPIFVDLTLYKELRDAGFSDDINLTINYAEVHKVVREFAKKQYQTIEALAETLASQILMKFHPKNVDVTVRKPYALRFKGVDYAAVEITR